MRGYLKYCCIIGVLLLLAGSSVWGQNADLLRASFLLDQQRYVEVLEVLDQEPVSRSDLSKYYEFIGRATFETGDLERSRDIYHKSLELSGPGYATYQLARISFLLKSNSEGYSFLRSYMKSGDHIPYREIMADEAFEDLTQDREWIRFWSDDWFTEKDDYFAEATSQLLQEQPVVELIQELQQNYPDDTQTWSISGRYFESIGDTKKAQSCFVKALEMDKNSIENIMNLAKVYLIQKNYSKCIDLVEGGLVNNPFQPSLRMIRIDALMKSGNTKEATSGLQFLEAKGVESPDIWISLAKQVMGNDVNAAIDLLDRVIEREPLHIPALNQRALLHYENQNFDEAFEDWSMSLDANPEQSEVYFKRGEMRYQIGDSEGACYDWKKALRYGHRRALDKLYKYCE